MLLRKPPQIRNHGSEGFLLRSRPAKIWDAPDVRPHRLPSESSRESCASTACAGKPRRTRRSASPPSRRQPLPGIRKLWSAWMIFAAATLLYLNFKTYGTDDKSTAEIDRPRTVALYWIARFAGGSFRNRAESPVPARSNILWLWTQSHKPFNQNSI